MYHYENGLYFQREENGSVTIIKTDDGKMPSIEDEASNIELRQTLTPEGWCSAVCSVSAAGEDNGRFYEAMQFHGEADTHVKPGGSFCE